MCVLARMHSRLAPPSVARRLLRYDIHVCVCVCVYGFGTHITSALIAAVNIIYVVKRESFEHIKYKLTHTVTSNKQRIITIRNHKTFSSCYFSFDLFQNIHWLFYTLWFLRSFSYGASFHLYCSVLFSCVRTIFLHIFPFFFHSSVLVE